jgi:hypothetical protein
LMKSASLFMRISKHSKTLSNRYKHTSLSKLVGKSSGFGSLRLEKRYSNNFRNARETAVL